MAQGSGLPQIEGDPVLTKPTGVASQGLDKRITLDPDSLVATQTWRNMAELGDKFMQIGVSELDQREHQEHAGYLADQEISATRARLDMQAAHPNDPAGFDRAWSAYADGRLSETEPWAVAHVKAILGQQGNGAYGSLLNDKLQRDEANNRSSVTALIDQSGNDVITSAMAGELNTPAGQVKMAKYHNVLDTGVTSGLMSQDEAAHRFLEITSRAGGETVIRGITDTYNQNRAAGLEAGKIAAKEVDDIFLRSDDPRLKGLSEDQRHAYHGKAMTEINTLEAERTKDLTLARQAVSEVTENMGHGVRPSQSTVESLSNQLLAAGGGAEAARLLRGVSDFDKLGSYGRMPLGDMVRENETLTSPLLNDPQYRQDLVSGIKKSADALGVNPSDLATAIGYETIGTFNTNIVGGKGNNYFGLIQFGAKERAQYGVHPGMTPSEQMEAVTQYLKDRGVTPGMGLKDIYSTILTGAPGNYNSRDQGGSVSEHVARMEANGTRGKANALLGGQSIKSHIYEADKAMNLTPQETALYERHFKNLTGTGGVDNPNGSRSSLFQATAEHDGKFYNIPTVWDGKKLAPADAVKRVAQEGWDKFPSYASEDAAQARYDQMHAFMEKDTGDFLSGRTQEPSPDLVRGERDLLKGKAKEEWTKAKSLYDQGLRPTPESFNLIMRAASLAGDTDTLEEMASREDQFNAAQEQGRQPLAAQQELQTGVAAQSAATGLPPGIAAYAKDQTGVIAATTDRLEHSPVSLAEERFPERYGPLPALDLRDGNATMGGLQERVNRARFVSENYKKPDVSVLSTADKTQIADAISQPDPQPTQAQNAFGMLSSIPDQFLMPTLNQKEIREAVTGAVNTNDPIKLMATMPAIDKLWARAPEDTERLIGADGVKRLQDWQAKYKYMAPEALADELTKANDPGVLAVQKEATDAARAYTKNVTADTVAADLAPAWFSSTGPTDPHVRDSVLAEYRAVFAERFAVSQNSSLAQKQTIERMRLYWGGSEANNGKLTLLPPEKYYPPINGSHDWMGAQLRADLKERLGYEPQDYSIVADAKTDTKSKAPSYTISFLNKNGEHEVMLGANHRPERYSWDRGGAVSDAETDFSLQRKRVLESRNETAGIVPGL